ncbi:MAG: PilZ domain-containing protein [Xanthobacteraceae bacterium]
MTALRLEGRKYRRRALEGLATIHPGDNAPASACGILDISDGGARLRVRQPSRMPDKFTVLLLGAVRRQCAVVWRSTCEIGVRFV